MLVDRELRILHALIDEFVLTSSPVASSTLVDRYHLGFSSATVRSILSELETGGFLHQPHVSAGRVPTDLGYRAFVDDYLKRMDDRPSDSSLNWNPVEDDIESFIARIVEDVADLTGSLVIITEPVREHVYIAQINIVYLGSSHIVLVMIGDDGKVVSKNLDLNQTLHQDELRNLEGRLNTLLADKEGKEAVDVLEQMIADENLPISSKVYETIVRSIPELYEGRSQRQGITSLFEQPELRELKAALPILSTIETDSALFDIFVHTTDEGFVSVRIGSELDDAHLEEFSVVAEPYRTDDAMGFVALIGPKRMNYIHSINAVRDGARALKTSL